MLLSGDFPRLAHKLLCSYEDDLDDVNDWRDQVPSAIPGLVQGNSGAFGAGRGRQGGRRGAVSPAQQPASSCACLTLAMAWTAATLMPQGWLRALWCRWDSTAAISGFLSACKSTSYSWKAPDTQRWCVNCANAEFWDSTAAISSFLSACKSISY